MSGNKKQVTESADGDLGPEVIDFLKEIGGCLREVREIGFNERIEVFCNRLGVSEVTYRRMEAGHRGTSIGAWATAFCLMGVNPKLISESAATKVLNRKAAEDVAKNNDAIERRMSLALRRMSDPKNNR